VSDHRPPDLSYTALFLVFLRFGALAFGGPVAQIGMIKRELIDEGGWLSRDHFNRLLAVMQALPGPEAHELCVHLGIRAKGRLGGLLAGLGFMLPGFILMMILSWLYFRFDLTNGWTAATFGGMQAAVIALIARAVHRIGEHVLTDRWLGVLAVASAIVTFMGVSFWITLPIAGLAYALARSGRQGLAALASLIGFGAGLWLAMAPQDAPSLPIDQALPVGVGSVAPVWLFLAGLKAGLLTFGGAYTAIPFVRGDTVSRGWLTDAQFLDGLALSGILPAPLIIFATFVGYAAGGPLGAMAMTAGMFLPAFAFSMIFYDRLEAIIDMPRLRWLLAGVAAGVVGLIAATALQLLSGLARTERPLAAVAIAAGCLVLAYVWKAKLAPIGIVILGAALGSLLAEPL
jgi:chromate transporter